jgi:hypothetical protein
LSYSNFISDQGVQSLASLTAIDGHQNTELVLLQTHF